MNPLLLFGSLQLFPFEMVPSGLGASVLSGCVPSPLAALLTLATPAFDCTYAQGALCSPPGAPNFNFSSIKPNSVFFDAVFDVYGLYSSFRSSANGTIEGCTPIFRSEMCATHLCVCAADMLLKQHCFRCRTTNLLLNPCSSETYYTNARNVTLCGQNRIDFASVGTIWHGFVVYATCLHQLMHGVLAHVCDTGRIHTSPMDTNLSNMLGIDPPHHVGSSSLSPRVCPSGSPNTFCGR